MRSHNWPIRQLFAHSNCCGNFLSTCWELIQHSFQLHTEWIMNVPVKNNRLTKTICSKKVKQLFPQVWSASWSQNSYGICVSSVWSLSGWVWGLFLSHPCQPVPAWHASGSLDQDTHDCNTHRKTYIRTVTYYMPFSVLTLEGKGVNCSRAQITCTYIKTYFLQHEEMHQYDPNT